MPPCLLLLLEAFFSTMHLVKAIVANKSIRTQKHIAALEYFTALPQIEHTTHSGT